MRLTVTTVDVNAQPLHDQWGIAPLTVGTAIDVGTAIGEPGAFGVVHEVSFIDGRVPAASLVVKIIDLPTLAHLGGPEQLVDRTRDALDAFAAAAPGWERRWMALPICVFHCDTPRGAGFATLMPDLRALGFRTVDAGDEAYDQMAARSIQDRLDTAAVFAERMTEFQDLGLIHGDLNPPNLMFSEDFRDVQIIDLDSVTWIGGASARPLTPGKMDDCMPPEVKVASGGADVTRLDQHAERWSIGIIIGHVLFGNNPLLYLATLSASALNALAALPDRWPHLDPNSPLYNATPQNQVAHQALCQQVAGYPHPVVEAFDQLVHAGTNGERRPSPLEWFQALTATGEPPEFEYVTISDDVVLTGELIGIEWSADRATSVEIQGVGTFAASGSTTFEAPRGQWQFQLTASNSFGQDRVMTKPVHVVEPPDISFIPIPAFERIEIRTSMPAPTAPRVNLQRLAPVDRALQQIDALRQVEVPRPNIDVSLPPLPSLTSTLPVDGPAMRVPSPLLGSAAPVRPLDRFKFLIGRTAPTSTTERKQTRS